MTLISVQYRKYKHGDYRLKLTTVGPDGTVKTELKFGNNRDAKRARKDLLNKQKEGQTP
jgi:hypothetical protein